VVRGLIFNLFYLDDGAAAVGAGEVPFVQPRLLLGNLQGKPSSFLMLRIRFPEIELNPDPG
jgi:hypothetical protein